MCTYLLAFLHDIDRNDVEFALMSLHHQSQHVYLDIFNDLPLSCNLGRSSGIQHCD